MKQTAIPVRFESGEAAFIKREAARHGLSRSEYLRQAVSRGMLASSIEDAISRVCAISDAHGGGITKEEFAFLLKNLLEVRNLLRLISVKNYPEAITQAKQEACAEVDKLFSSGE
jgi:hypothetical protein